MKLLIITQKVDKNAPILGFFHRWIQEFAKHTEKLTIICLEAGEYDLPENVTVLSLGKEEKQSRWQYFRRFFSYIFHYRNQYDAVFVHMNPIYVLLGGPFWHMSGKTIALWYTHKSVTTKLRVAEKMADIIFSASERSFRMESDKVRYVGHGIDTELFSPAEQMEQGGRQRFSILTVGRISPVKDYETLLEAVQVLKESTDIDFSVTIVGGPVTAKDESYFQKLQEFVSENNLEKHVEFVGSVFNTEVVSYYQRADVFVNMSKTGSLDKVVLEAMATETYPLTSNEAFRDIFGDNCEKYMFGVGDPRSLVKKFKDIATRRLSEEGLHELRRIVEEGHSIKALIPHLLDYIFPKSQQSA